MRISVHDTIKSIAESKCIFYNFIEPSGGFKVHAVQPAFKAQIDAINEFADSLARRSHLIKSEVCLDSGFAGFGGFFYRENGVLVRETRRFRMGPDDEGGNKWRARQRGPIGCRLPLPSADTVAVAASQLTDAALCLPSSPCLPRGQLPSARINSDSIQSRSFD